MDADTLDNIVVDHEGIIHEITPLMKTDALYIADRHKKNFTYPMHVHDAYELNFVAHAGGVKRIVGDSSEVIGDYDLVLITNYNLEHTWEQNACKSDDIHEITVQFDFMDENNELFSRNSFKAIGRMIEKARRGLCFPMDTIMKVYDKIISLSTIKDGFYASMRFMGILYELSKSTDARMLASESYSKVVPDDDSKRILKVKEYISNNYREELRLSTLSSIANMSESAFSRYFKLHTGRTLTQYIIDVRLGYATRQLVDTQNSVAEISFNCGFNNLSNFNRIFRQKKQCSPTEFRNTYRTSRIII